MSRVGRKDLKDSLKFYTEVKTVCILARAVPLFVRLLAALGHLCQRVRPCSARIDMETMHLSQ